jgi:hypothetical protein
MASRSASSRVGRRKLLLKSLRLDYQPHQNLIPLRVEENIRKIRAGESLEPVLVCYDGEKYWLYDGFHRVEALKSLGRKRVDADVFVGTFDEMEAEFKQRYLPALKDFLRNSS